MVRREVETQDSSDIARPARSKHETEPLTRWKAGPDDLRLSCALCMHAVAWVCPHSGTWTCRERGREGKSLHFLGGLASHRPCTSPHSPESLVLASPLCRRQNTAQKNGKPFSHVKQIWGIRSANARPRGRSWSSILAPLLAGETLTG